MSNSPALASPRVIGIGECVIDVINKDGVQRRVPGGCPMNTAIALSRQGLRSAVISPVSITDEDGVLIVDHLKRSGVDISLLKPTEKATTLAVLNISESGNASYTFEMEDRTQSQWEKQDVYKGPVQGDILLVSGSFSLATHPMSEVFDEIFEVGSKYHVIYFDPNVREGIIGDDPKNIEKAKSLFDKWVAKSTIVKASSEDVAWRYPELTLREAAEVMLGDGNKLIFITDGPNPVVVASTKMGIFEIDLQPLDPELIVDTVGAGDTFSAGVLKWLIDNDKISKDQILGLNRTEARDLVSCASELSTQVCMIAGANPPWAKDLRSESGRFFIAE